jgi:hypothetical protein
MSNGIICPFCLSQSSITRKVDEKGLRYWICTNSTCQKHIPAEYMNYPAVPKEVISAVGFRGHGKSVYFASLFKSMGRFENCWPGFYTHPIEERSLDTVIKNAKSLENGKLPDPTQANFLEPTIVRFTKIPGLGDRFFIFCDTAGENFERASALVRNASFVRFSRTVTFFLSLQDLEYDGNNMRNLLSTYVQGLTELGGNPKDQHLLVILSKADELKLRMARREATWHYLESGVPEELKNIAMGNYMGVIRKVSSHLKKFIREDLKASGFISFGEDRFKSLEISIVSALGAKPVGNKLQVEINPKRIMDPIVWIAYQSLGRFERAFL